MADEMGLQETGPAAADGGDVVLKTRGLTKIYGTGSAAVRALRGVDLEVEKGELIVLLGPSGSGKSTLLNILGGLDSASEGEVWFEGQVLNAHDDRSLTAYRRDHVGFVFQFYNLIPSLTARENVELVTEIAHNPLRAEEALALVGLAERVNHFPAELSGGEQQRVAVARAIAKRPDILLCDEPTGALDSVTGIKVLEALDRVNRELHATTLIITHNIAISDMADRVIYFADGRILKSESKGRARRPSDLSW